MRYSRIIVLFSVSIACVAINFWLITTGHYRLPLFVFLGCVFLITFVLRRLPPVTLDTRQIRTIQLRAASSFRRLGFMFVGGFVLGLVNLFSGGFRDLPTWAIILVFCWGGFLIWACFWYSRQYKKSIAEREDIPSGNAKT